MIQSFGCSFDIGDQAILGGSVATVVGTGVSYDRVGAPYLVLLVECPDFGPGIIKLRGSETYALHDIS